MYKKDINKVRYYATNTLTLILSLKDIVYDPPYDPRKVELELNDSLKFQISNSVKNLALSVGYLYNIPGDTIDVLIQIPKLFAEGILDNCLSNLDSARAFLLNESVLDYDHNLNNFISLYNLKASPQDRFSHDELSNITYTLNDLFGICVVLLSQGDVDNFIVKDKEEYKDMIMKYTLNF